MKYVHRAFSILLENRLIKTFLYRKKYIGMIISHRALVKGDIATIGKNIFIGEECKVVVPQNSYLEISGNVMISERCQIYPSKISIGKNTSLQTDCKLLGDIELGQDILFAPNVFISSGTHNFMFSPELPIKVQDSLVLKKQNKDSSKKVIVDNDCWLGTNSVVMPGVRIGKGSIIGANSVVTKDVSPYSVVAGSPAKIVKQRLNFTPSKIIDSKNHLHSPYFYTGYYFDKNQDMKLTRSFTVALPKFSLPEIDAAIYATSLDTHFEISINGSSFNWVSGSEEEISIKPSRDDLFDFQLIHINSSSELSAFRIVIRN